MTGAGSVTVVGSVNLDTTFRVPRIPLAGETITSEQTGIAPGGKGANQAAAAAASGARVRFIGAIGDDNNSDAAIQNLRAWGVDLTGLQRFASTQSGSALLLVSTDAENVIVISPGANASLDPKVVARSLAEDSSSVLLTQLETPLSVLRVCASARRHRWRILNPAPMSDDPDLPVLLEEFNVLVPNRNELAQLAGLPVPRSLDEVRTCALALGFNGALVVTLGADGAAVFSSYGEEPELIAPPAVHPIDTSGAGDVFCGTLARQLAAHDDLTKAVRAAVDASARSTETAGAQLAHGGEAHRE